VESVSSTYTQLTYIIFLLGGCGGVWCVGGGWGGAVRVVGGGGGGGGVAPFSQSVPYDLLVGACG